MATAAAAIAGRLRREVEQLFFDNDAFSPDRAIQFEPRAPIQQRYLEQLMAQGIVHQVEPGRRYWFDLPVYKEMRQRQFVWSMRVLGIAAVIFVVIFAVRTVMHFR